MKQRVPISKIMSETLVTINPSQNLYEVENLMNKHGIRHIPVTEGSRLVGVISRTDLLKISVADLSEDEENVESVVYDMYTIPQVMTKLPVFVDVEDTIKDAADLLSKQSFHSLPVLDKGNLVGIVTTTDLINYFLEQY